MIRNSSTYLLRETSIIDTPVSCAPCRMAQDMGAEPRHCGRSEGCMFIEPLQDMNDSCVSTIYCIPSSFPISHGYMYVTQYASCKCVLKIVNPLKYSLKKNLLLLVYIPMHVIDIVIAIIFQGIEEGTFDLFPDFFCFMLL